MYGKQGFKVGQIVRHKDFGFTAKVECLSNSQGHVELRVISDPKNEVIGGVGSIFTTRQCYFKKYEPKRIKKALDAKTRALYQLDWIDEELELTSTGKAQLMDILHDEYADKLGELAQKEVKRIKAEEKK